MIGDCIFKGIAVISLKRGLYFFHDDFCLKLLGVLRKNGEKFVDGLDVVAEKTVFEQRCQSFVDIGKQLLALGVFGFGCLGLLKFLVFAGFQPCL